MANGNGNYIPENVTSYDTGNKPFKPDVGRGKWASKWDFYAVALSHCCGFRHYLIFFVVDLSSAVYISIAYMLGMLAFSLPLYFTQMFLGQFSSTGGISVFRIAPLFKGVGYISLFLNIMTCSFLMVSAAFPLCIIFESMQPYLPWAHCTNHYNSEQCSVIQPGSLNTTTMDIYDFYTEFENIKFPVHEYLNHILNFENETDNWYFLWRIILCTLLVWTLIGLVLYNGVEMFGKIFRYITLIIFLCMFLTTIRILCVHESWEAIGKFFEIKLSSLRHHYIFLSPVLAATVFGAGWGNVLTIASYNNLKEDIGKMSLIVCFTQMVVFMIALINYISMVAFLQKYFGYTYRNIRYDNMPFIFVAFSLYFSHLGWPHFWTILFFIILFLNQFSEGAIQMLTILTAIFDEYEYMRIYKKAVLGGLIGVLGLISIFFCTTNGFSSLSTLYGIAGANKTIIMLIELFVVLWIYGRLRFQRDVKFITGKSIQSWKVWMMRFLTPIVIGIVSLFFMLEAHFNFRGRTIMVILIFIFLALTPILYLPGYMIHKIYRASGNILERIKKLCRPTDWYPVDPVEHNNYENYLGSADITNELVHVNLTTETVDI